MYMSERDTAIVYKLQRCNLFTGAVLCFAVALEYVFSAIFRGSFGTFQGEFARRPRVFFPCSEACIAHYFSPRICFSH